MIILIALQVFDTKIRESTHGYHSISFHLFKICILINYLFFVCVCQNITNGSFPPFSFVCLNYILMLIVADETISRFPSPGALQSDFNGFGGFGNFDNYGESDS